MSLRFKPGVVKDGLHEQMYFALGIADRAFADEGLECVVTAALDGDHNPDSLHGRGYAVDIHNADCTPEQHDRILEKLKRLDVRYGFDIVDEQPGQTAKTTGRHFHIEFDPKKGEVGLWRPQFALAHG